MSDFVKYSRLSDLKDEKLEISYVGARHGMPSTCSITSTSPNDAREARSRGFWLPQPTIGLNHESTLIAPVATKNSDRDSSAITGTNAAYNSEVCHKTIQLIQNQMRGRAAGGSAYLQRAHVIGRRNTLPARFPI